MSRKLRTIDTREFNNVPSIKTYFLQGEITKAIKIGKTVGPVDWRCKEIQAYSPDTLVVLKYVVDNLEEYCHAKFAHLRMHGEWFRPDPELLEFISKL